MKQHNNSATDSVKHMDYQVVIYVLFLVSFGILMVYSASSYTAYNLYGKSSYFAIKQTAAAVLGFIAMILIAKFPYHIIIKWTKVFLLLSILMLFLVLIIGTTKNGSSRWLRLGPISFQPSELSKLSLILYMAHICTARYRDLKTLKGTGKIFLFPVIMIILIALENLSTAIVCGGIAFAIWFTTTPKPKYTWIIVALAVLFLVLMVLSKGYRSNRFTAWLNPEETTNGYQTMQSLYAIGTGGLFGKGLGNSIQKRGYIPEAQNDMIFSIICEELGIVGAIGLILVFIFLIWRLKIISENSKDLFGSLIVIGVMAHISIQAILNMFVVTNLMPNTGVTLPFISYGGTSLISLFLEIGIVLSVSIF